MAKTRYARKVSKRKGGTKRRANTKRRVMKKKVRAATKRRGHGGGWNPFRKSNRLYYASLASDSMKGVGEGTDYVRKGVAERTKSVKKGVADRVNRASAARTRSRDRALCNTVKYSLAERDKEMAALIRKQEELKKIQIKLVDRERNCVPVTTDFDDVMDEPRSRNE
tara:strand:- start:4982 stop:5482 length:501 start_codon:yes stop_codon:yes gene_type:complete